MSDTLQWVNIVLSSGILVTLGRGLVKFGRVLQRQDEHERRIEKVEEKVERPLYQVVTGAPQPIK